MRIICAICKVRRQRLGTIWLRICVIVGIVLLFACSSFEPVKNVKRNGAIAVTEVDNGTTVEVHVGETVVLRLPENATTGYRWAIEGLNADLVEAQEEPYTSQSNTVGGGGEAGWTLHAKTPGVTEIKLRLWRHWEGERSVLRRFGVTLRIAPP